jgi:hypothetical protein
MMPNESPLSEDLPDLPDEVRLDVQGKVIAAVMASPDGASVDWPGLLNAVATRMEEWMAGGHPSSPVYDWVRGAQNHDVVAMCAVAAVTLSHIKGSWHPIVDEFEGWGARLVGTVVARFATGTAMDTMEAVTVYGFVQRASVHERLVLLDVFAASLLAVHFPSNELRVLRT